MSRFFCKLLGCQFESADTALCCSRECASFMAKKLALDQAGGMDPQLTLTRGRSLRRLGLCTARARSSLPVHRSVQERQGHQRRYHVANRSLGCRHGSRSGARNRIRSRTAAESAQHRQSREGCRTQREGCQIWFCVFEGIECDAGYDHAGAGTGQ
jgi:hypothetical protein